MTSRELDKKITEKKNAIWNDIELLTALKVHCEEPYCRAIDNAIQALKEQRIMKHTECEDCELSNGDCGHHFKSEIYSNTGITTNYDIASLSACDQYGNCMFFKSKAKLKGDLISREALKEEFLKYKPYAVDFLSLINNAPTVEYTFEEAFQKTVCENKLYCPARPKGEWIFRRGVTCGGYYKCNRCGEVERAEKNYCSNCGADMRGEK